MDEAKDSTQVKQSGYAPLKIKEFRHFIIARFLYIMALRMTGTVVAYKLFQLTQDSFSIGLAGLSEFVPVVCLALYAGHIIDKSDKRTLLLRGMLAYAGCAILLLLVSSGWAESLTGNKKTLALFYYLVIFFTGVIRAFAGPTTNAILSQLVPRSILPLAASISSTTWLAASITGHAGAGFLIAGMGVHHTFFVILGGILVACWSISAVSRKPAGISPASQTRAWASVKEGLSFVWNNKTMLGAISLDLFAVLFGGAVALLPEFADKILKTGPIGFGWLNASMDIGCIIILIYVTFFPIRQKQGKLLFYAIAGFGLCIIIFGLSSVYAISFVALLLAGMLDGISVTIRGTILQLTTPEEMRGRVSSVNSIFINSSNELGQFESGFTARLFGAAPAVVFGGCMTLLVVIITWFKAPTLRKMEY